MAVIDELRGRLAELSDLAALSGLASWDQQVMMPRRGSPARAHQLATLDRLAHELAAADELGDWLAQIEGDSERLSELDRDIVRIAQRDYERRRCVPAELVGELSQAASAGQSAWRQAREASDFAAFAPALRRNVELAREYAACFSDAPRAYDALLDDYDFGLPTERIKAVFSELAEGLAPLLTELPQTQLLSAIEVPLEAQKAAVNGTLERVGVSNDRWRVDVSAHPFSESLNRDDLRITTRYEGEGVESLIAALHEFGHSLYEAQIAPELERTNLGQGTSMSVHESQSKLWENHVARSPAFAPVLSEELRRGGYSIGAGELSAAVNQIRPSLIRVSADQITYPLHIILRFELELGLIEGDLDVEDLPGVWNEGMRRLLGVAVPEDRLGVLQDIHWAAGLFGYFPSYAIGCLIAAQLWQQIETELGPQEAALRNADVGAIREWLGQRIHRHGRRFDTEPLVVQATGRGIEVQPFLAHARALAGAA